MPTLSAQEVAQTIYVPIISGVKVVGEQDTVAHDCIHLNQIHRVPADVRHTNA